MTDMTEEEIIEMLENEGCSADDFLVLSKALCGKRGMSNREWEDQFHEQELKEQLQEYGLSEDLVSDVAACTIRAMFADNDNIEHLLPFDQNRKPTCSVCHTAPYKAVEIDAKPRNGNKERPLVIIALVCKPHFERIHRQDVDVFDRIREIVMHQKKMG